MPLDGPQLAEQGTVFNKNFFADFKVSKATDYRWREFFCESLNTTLSRALLLFVVLQHSILFPSTAIYVLGKHICTAVFTVKYTTTRTVRVGKPGLCHAISQQQHLLA